jgi:hypothetical protein
MEGGRLHGGLLLSSETSRERHSDRQRLDRRGVAAGHDAVVMPMKLVAEHGIAQEAGEVVEEIELTLNDVRIRLPRSRIVGARDAARLLPLSVQQQT